MKDLEAQTGNSCYNYNTTTSSILQEKQLQETAVELVKNLYKEFDESIITNLAIPQEVNNFVNFAKSEAAKQYWFSIFEEEKSQTEKRLDEFIKNNFDGKPSYSEEEVKLLFEIFKVEFSLHRNVQILNYEFEQWFDQHKKK